MDSSFSLLRFIGAKEPSSETRIYLAGFPYDGTSSYRTGARFAPDAIRQASYAIETYDPLLNEDIETIPFADIGDLDLENGFPEQMLATVRKSLSTLENGIPVLGMGGEHTITEALFAHALEQHPDVCFIVFDAHTDLRDEYEGSQHSHACTTRRVMDTIGPERIAMFGIRSGTREEWDIVRSNAMLHDCTVDGFSAVLERWKNKPIYVSIDLDGFDPSELPGTGVVEPGGFTWKEVEPFFSLLKQSNLVGADVVELAPQWDPTGRSEILAARLLRMLLIAMNK